MTNGRQENGERSYKTEARKDGLMADHADDYLRIE